MEAAWAVALAMVLVAMSAAEWVRSSVRESEQLLVALSALAKARVSVAERGSSLVEDSATSTVRG